MSTKRKSRESLIAILPFERRAYGISIRVVESCHGTNSEKRWKHQGNDVSPMGGIAIPAGMHSLESYWVPLHWRLSCTGCSWFALKKCKHTENTEPDWMSMPLPHLKLCDSSDQISVPSWGKEREIARAGEPGLCNGLNGLLWWLTDLRWNNFLRLSCNECLYLGFAANSLPCAYFQLGCRERKWFCLRYN